MQVTAFPSSESLSKALPLCHLLCLRLLSLLPLLFILDWCCKEFMLPMLLFAEKCASVGVQVQAILSRNSHRLQCSPTLSPPLSFSRQAAQRTIFSRVKPLLTDGLRCWSQTAVRAWLRQLAFSSCRRLDAISIIASTSSALLKKGKRRARRVSKMTPTDQMSILVDC